MKATEWKVGVSTSGDPELHLAEMAEAGIDCVEISTGDEYYDTYDWKAKQAESRSTGVRLWSVHLPFYSLMKKRIIDIAHMDPAVRKSTNEYCAEIIKAAGDIGVAVAVTHPGLEPTLDPERSERLKYSAESLAYLAEVCASSGMTLAVENLPRTCLGNCSDDFKTLLSCDDRVKVVFDTNHLLIQKNPDFIRALGDKIISLHVSDYDFLNERHWMPYEGKNDWVEIVTALEEVGYEGPWMYEIGIKTPQNIVRPRNLTYADFRENYEALIRKEKAPVLGTPDLERCMAEAYYKKPYFEEN